MITLIHFAPVKSETLGDYEVVVLGVAQDAGYPQINCYRPHCADGWREPSKMKLATSIAVIDPIEKKKYVFEATPDIKSQFYRLHQIAPDPEYRLAGIFLTHAHIGHYTGLMHLGREAMGANQIPVFVMPKMAKFLSTNGPWSQLVQLKNIKLSRLSNGEVTKLGSNLKVTPFTVPHRDEYSETVGFKVVGPNKSLLFIPDIDKWQKWEKDLASEIKKVDYAFLDATFFQNGELPNRDMSEVPHPFVEETMALLDSLSAREKSKVIFIHFNHTNPLLKSGSRAQEKVILKGFRYAEEGMRLPL
ncbi:MBL fold metallo-hydrolase [Aliikangiella marina]|uniref:MBL fold metallo-hydrolase n=1 Tax=Aliikangiella marina TaxID=1712262 RepID=UPI001AEE6F87|nr:MBL fold metallo-hydrolase [Aliikangiella marina]